MKMMTMLAALAAAMCALAAKVPSAAEVRVVGKYLDELTKDDRQSLSQRKSTKEQYGDALAGYAADEKKPAAKFALFREAFRNYADAKSWEKADGVYSSAQTEGGTEYALAVVGRTMIPGAAAALKSRIDADRKSYARIGQLKGMLKKTPGDEALCESLGLEYAAVGEWDKALAAFLTAPGEVAKVADWELNKGSAYTAAKAAKFWWDYADGKPKAKMEAVRLHAAMWYELALGENAYSGNEAKIVQGRIEETKSYGGAAIQEKATIAKQVNELKPIVLPIKGKTLIEFVGVPAGEFMMGTEDERFIWKIIEKNSVKPHCVNITRPFWLSKYKVTKELWAAFQKVELTEYDKVMGGMKVPQPVSYLEAMEFCDCLTKKFRNKLPSHYVVRLPTEAEWEYACKVGESGEGCPYYDWDNIKQFSVQAVDVRKRAENTKLNLDDKHDWEFMPIEVGAKKPNAFGFYDILGNGFELTLDTFDPSLAKVPENTFSVDRNSNQTALIYDNKETDPLRFFRIVHNAFSVLRGAASNNMSPHLYAKRGCPVHSRGTNVQTTTLRLCIGPDLMKEKGYKFKPPKK